jgi:hypothetical protein
MRKIYLTEQVDIDHPKFLRLLTSFLVEASFKISLDDGMRAASCCASYFAILARRVFERGYPEACT